MSKVITIEVKVKVSEQAVQGVLGYVVSAADQEFPGPAQREAFLAEAERNIYRDIAAVAVEAFEAGRAYERGEGDE